MKNLLWTASRNISGPGHNHLLFDKKKNYKLKILEACHTFWRKTPKTSQHTFLLTIKIFNPHSFYWWLYKNRHFYVKFLSILFITIFFFQLIIFLNMLWMNFFVKLFFFQEIKTILKFFYIIQILMLKINNINKITRSNRLNGCRTTTTLTLSICVRLIS